MFWVWAFRVRRFGGGLEAEELGASGQVAGVVVVVVIVIVVVVRLVV